jgi:hypothetical protein
MSKRTEDLRLSLSLFVGPILKHWIPTECCVDFWRSYLDCAVHPPSLSLSLSSIPPHHSLWPSSSNRIHCVPPLGGGGISCWGRRRQTDSVDRPVFRFLLHRFLFLFVFIIQPSSPFCAQRHLDNTTCHGGQCRRLSESALQLELGSLSVCVCIYAVRPSGQTSTTLSACYLGFPVESPSLSLLGKTIE